MYRRHCFREGIPFETAFLGQFVGWIGGPEYPLSGRYESSVLGFGLFLVALGIFLLVPGLFPGISRVTGIEILGVGVAVAVGGAILLLRRLTRR